MIRHAVKALCFENGDFYVGDWQNLTPHGQGKMRKANGEILEGEFENGIFKG